MTTATLTTRDAILELFDTDTAELTIMHVVGCLDKSETTVRKAMKDLFDEGVLEVLPGPAPRIFRRKPATPTEEVNMTKTAKADKAEATEKKRPGRPPDPEARARDEKVFKALGTDGLGVAALAEKLDVTPAIAYLSIWRLRKDGRVEKARDGTRTPVWKPVA